MLTTWEEGADEAADFILADQQFSSSSADVLVDELKRTVRQLREDHFDQGRVKRWFFGALPFTYYMRRLAHLALDLADAVVGADVGDIDPDGAVRSITWLIARKQHDYGHGNITAFGQRGLVVRINDKIERLANLRSRGGKNAVQGETLVDTLQDIVGYALIGVMLDQGTFTLPLAADTEVFPEHVLHRRAAYAVDSAGEVTAPDDGALDPTEFRQVFGEDEFHRVFGDDAEMEVGVPFVMDVTVASNPDGHAAGSSPFQEWLNDLAEDELGDWRK